MAVFRRGQLLMLWYECEGRYYYIESRALSWLLSTLTIVRGNSVDGIPGRVHFGFAY